jgi:threonine/homoserine/homoserine lactone efflux protein
VLLGLAIAVPVGPVGLLCIRRTCRNGAHIGFMSGLGAASMHALYAAIGADGLTLISAFFAHHAAAIRFAGGLFVVYVGLRVPRAPASASANEALARGAASAYVSAALFTLANPRTIVLCSAFFAASLPAHGMRNGSSVTLTVAGTFVGSAAWWLVLSVGVGILRLSTDTRTLHALNRVAGAAIALFGIAMIESASQRETTLRRCAARAGVPRGAHRRRVARDVR